MSQSCATCPVRSRTLNRRSMFRADIDSLVTIKQLAKISETCRARDLSRRVTVQRIASGRGRGAAQRRGDGTRFR